MLLAMMAGDLCLVGFLCRVQKEFHWTGLLGLGVVVIGIAVYNDIYFVTAVRKITGESGTTCQYEKLATAGGEAEMEKGTRG